MTTVIAVANHAHLVKFGAVLSLRSPLPRIFSAVAKEDVRACSVEATLVDGGLVSPRVDTHVKAAEGIRAVLREVGLIHHGAPHGSLLVHRLEPTVFSAVLEGPGTAAAVDVNLSASDSVSVVIGRV